MVVMLFLDFSLDFQFLLQCNTLEKYVVEDSSQVIFFSNPSLS